jgi:hypothetical protein
MKVLNKAFLLTIAGFLFSFLIVGCDKSESGNIVSEYDYIAYGTSFGMCLGYCQHSFKITALEIEFEQRGWNLDGELPAITRTEKIDNKYWNILNKGIDYNNFFQLDTIYGCPDCADGGAEWIEIGKDSVVHKITFEYRNEPTEVSNFIGYLRTYLVADYSDTAGVDNFDETVLVGQKAKIKSFARTRGSYQYLLELAIGNTTSYYFDPYLDPVFQQNGLQVIISGVLQGDSTLIQKPAPDDVPIPDFKARNIIVCAIKNQ